MSRSPALTSKHPTLGLLVAQLDSYFQGPIWHAVAQVAHERGANLLCFVGGYLQPPPHSTLANDAYQLPSPANVDGLIIVMSSIGLHATPQQNAHFCARYEDLPLVTVASHLPGYPGVICDNVTGLRAALEHLITHHGYQRIAFIRGPKAHPEANLRYQVYRETLAAHGIAYDAALVGDGDFQHSDLALRQLFDERNLALDALVASNDVMALQALEGLQARGLRVPQDIALVGFDDLPQSRYLLPPLTTVRQPVFEMGRRAAELLLDRLAGKDTPLHLTMPTEFVVRDSCGCTLDSPARHYIPALREFASHSPEETAAELEERLLMALEQQNPEGFLAPLVEHLQEIALQTIARRSRRPFDQELDRYRAALDRLHTRWSAGGAKASATGTTGDGSEDNLRAEILLCRAHELIQQVALSVQAGVQQKNTRYIEALYGISESLIATGDIPQLMAALTTVVDEVEIPGCYVGLYEDAATLDTQATDIAATMHLLLAYHQSTRLFSGRNGQQPNIYSTRELLPAPLLQQIAPYHLILEPLYFQELPLGLALFEVGPTDGVLYAMLGRQLSSALRGAQLRASQQAAYAEVEARVAQRTQALEREIAERRRIERARNVLYRISEAAHTARNLHDLYTFIHARVGELLPADNFYIALYDSATGMLNFPYFVDVHDPPPDPKPAGKGLTELVIHTQRSMLVDPKMFDTLVASGAIELIGAPSLDWLGVPLTFQDETFGALVVQTYDPNVRYTATDEELLTFVSAQIATTIKRVQGETERAELLATLRRRTTQLQTTAEVSRAASTMLKPQELLPSVVELIRERFDFYYVGLYLVDETEGDVVLRAATGEAGRRLLAEKYRLKVGSRSLTGWCARTGTARVAHDVTQDDLYLHHSYLPQTRSEIVLPLNLPGGICLGVLTAQSTYTMAFSEEDVAILQSMADHLAIAIENAQLHARISQHAAELEARVAERTAELVVANRELASFSYSVSHDLRAPLRSIDGFSQAVLEDYGDSLDAVGLDYLQRVRRASQRMGELIDDLLKLSRVTRGEMHRSELDLAPLAQEIFATLQAQEPQRAVTLELPPELPAMGDPRLLRIVLENLLGNAWKFTGCEARAEIALGMTTQVVEGAPPGVTPVTPIYYVRDNGVGFDPAYADKLFGAFQRLHSSDDFEGNGVGLATVQRIIHRHGGRLWATGAPGEGATFYFTLTPPGS